MKTDAEQRYIQHMKQCSGVAEIKLKNGRILNGIVAGYCKDYAGAERISRWHVVNETDKLTMGIDAFGFLIGEIIDDKDIEVIIYK